MSTHIPLRATKSQAATLLRRQERGIETSILHPHHALNRGIYAAQTQPLPQPAGGREQAPLGLEHSSDGAVLPSMRVAVVSLPELDAGRVLSRRVKAEEEVRNGLLKQKEQLHKESVARTQTWPQTISGNIRLGLQRQKEKDQLAELERLKIDQEWHITLAKERSETLSKVRALQLQLSNPTVRNLHSSLLLSNVLAERDAQVAFKRDAIAAASAAMSSEKVPVQGDFDQAREILRVEGKRREARKIVAGYFEEAEKKLRIARAVKESDREFQKKVIEVAQQEIQDEVAAEKLFKHASGTEIEQAYMQAMAYKKAKPYSKKHEDAQILLEQQLDQKYRDTIAAKRKEVAETKKLDQERIYNAVIKMNQELAAESEARIAQAISVMENAHKGAAEARIIHDFERKLELEKRVMDGRKKQIEDLKLRRKIEKDEELAERRKNEQASKEFEAAQKAEKAKAADALRKQTKDLLEQISQNRERNRRTQEEEKALELSLLEMHKKDEDEERQALHQAIDEFREQGKNITPALHILKPRQPFPPAQFETRVNTFTRLGFT